MSYLRFTSTYYSTQVTTITWKADIYDRDVEPAQVIHYEASGAPEVRYTGLPQDFKPGIYPTEYNLGMYIRHTPVLNNEGTFYYGPTDTILDDLFTSSEGRFILKLYKNDVLVFIGIILPDQCSFEDGAEPYELTIQAVDGLFRLQSEQYMSEVGTINYVTLGRFTTGDYGEFDSTPVTTGNYGFPLTLTGSEWIMIEHISEKNGGGLFNGKSSYRNTTYARYELYQVDSPGTGWVDQGSGLWAKELDYFNEIIVDESDYYHLTRDIDNTPFRTIAEFIQRGMSLIPCKDEYGTDCMYDVVDTWYETGMYDLTKCPTEMMRVSERKLAIGNTWSGVLSEIVEMLYMRLYYSDGRYHFEQISERTQTTIDRHKYQSGGTFISTETVDLDIDYSTLRTDGAETATNGVFKFLAPLKSAEVTVNLSGSNLISGHDWRLSKQGSQYLARVKKTEDTVRLLIHLKFLSKSVFDLTGLPAEFYDSFVRFAIRIRVTNITTGTTYHLTPEAVDNFQNSTWETDPIAGVFIHEQSINNVLGGVAFRGYDFYTLSDDLPGDNGDSFDLYVSINFETYLGAFASYWTVDNPTKYHRYCNTEDECSITTVDDDSQPVNANAAIVYAVTNDVDNSLKYERTAKFTDNALKDESIEIKSSGSPISWRKSSKWNRNGDVTGSCEICLLEAREAMSLRVVPLRIYSGSFLTGDISVQNRISRLTYIYLPLSVSINTDMDEIQGEFVNIARTTPPDGTTTEIPSTGDTLGSPVDVYSGDPDSPNTPQPIPMGFVTNEAITAADTLTECDIINTDGVFVQNGTIIKILDTTTGLYEDVKLTQSILPSDSVMHFESHLFTYSFPTGSPLSLVGDIVTYPTNVNQIYQYFDPDFTGTEISAPNFAFVDPEYVSPKAIDIRFQVWRGGIKQKCDFGAASDPDRISATYYFDNVARKWKFYGDGLINEQIIILAW